MPLPLCARMQSAGLPAAIVARPRGFARVPFVLAHCTLRGASAAPPCVRKATLRCSPGRGAPAGATGARMLIVKIDLPGWHAARAAAGVAGAATCQCMLPSSFWCCGLAADKRSCGSQRRPCRSIVRVHTQQLARAPSHFDSVMCSPAPAGQTFDGLVPARVSLPGGCFPVDSSAFALEHPCLLRYRCPHCACNAFMLA